MINKLVMKEIVNILRMYEVTSQDLDVKLPEIMEREGLILTQAEINDLYNNYSLVE